MSWFNFERINFDFCNQVGEISYWKLVKFTVVILPESGAVEDMLKSLKSFLVQEGVVWAAKKAPGM